MCVNLTVANPSACVHCKDACAWIGPSRALCGATARQCAVMCPCVVSSQLLDQMLFKRSGSYLIFVHGVCSMCTVAAEL